MLLGWGDIQALSSLLAINENKYLYAFSLLHLTQSFAEWLKIGI